MSTTKYLDYEGLLYSWGKLKALLSEKADIVSLNTSSGWANKTSYVPKLGEFCLYTDTQTLKIGDGQVAIVDLPFVKDKDVPQLMEALNSHVNDKNVHITNAERSFWNDKLNCTVSNEELVFTRQ